jgi:hypothetical protein
MEAVGIFYGHLVYFTAIGYILLPFGILCGNLVYFVVIWYIFKSGNPEQLLPGLSLEVRGPP